jgi:hypothetical protein
MAVRQQVGAQDRVIERLPGLPRARMAVHINKTWQHKPGLGDRPGARYRTAADPAMVGPQFNGLAARKRHPADVQLHAITLDPPWADSHTFCPQGAGGSGQDPAGQDAQARTTASGSR